MPMDFPSRPKGADLGQSSYDDDPEKAKFMRFLKMVERKKDAADKR